MARGRDTDEGDSRFLSKARGKKKSAAAGKWKVKKKKKKRTAAPARTSTVNEEGR